MSGVSVTELTFFCQPDYRMTLYWELLNSK